jgi:hypothetical protein
MQNTHEKDATLPKPQQPATQPARTLNYKKSYQYYLDQRRQKVLLHLDGQVEGKAKRIPPELAGFFYLPAYAAQRAACQSNDVEQAKIVLPKEEYEAWLWFSLKNKCTPIWQWLFNLLPDKLYTSAQHQNKFIHMAIATGNPSALQYLLQTGRRIDQESPSAPGYHSSHSILHYDELAMMKILLDHMKSKGLLSAYIRQYLLNSTHDYAQGLNMVQLVYTELGVTLDIKPLLNMRCHPILDAEPALVQKLINQALLWDKNWNDSYMDSACKTGKLEMIRIFIANGTKPNFNTLFFACGSGDRDTVKELLSHSVPVNPENDLPLNGSGYLNVADLLIEHGHIPTDDSLYDACTYDNLEKAKLFIGKGVQLNEHALKLACYSGNPTLVRELLAIYKKHKKKLKQPNFLLFEAYKSGNRAITEELKRLGFQIEYKDLASGGFFTPTTTTAAMALILNPREQMIKTPILPSMHANASFWSNFSIDHPWSTSIVGYHLFFGHLLLCCHALDNMLHELRGDNFDYVLVKLARAHEAAPRQFFLKISHILAHPDQYQLETSAYKFLAESVKKVIDPSRYSSVEKDDIKQSLALAESETNQPEQLQLLKEIHELVFSASQSTSASAGISTAGASTAFLHSPITAAGDARMQIY